MGFIMRSLLPWMSAKAMKKVSEGHKWFLGRGSTALVRLVPHEGKLACMKEGFTEEMIPRLIGEAVVLRHLEGAGGAPRLLGICKEEPKLLMTYSGRSTAFAGWRQTTPLFWVTAFQYIFQRLFEIHQKGACHNDIHWGNVVVQNTLDGKDLDVKLIDFGLTEPLFDLNSKAQVKDDDPPPGSDLIMAGCLMRVTMNQLDLHDVVKEDDWPRGMLQLRDILNTGMKHTAVEALERIEPIKSRLNPATMGFYDWTKPKEDPRKVPFEFLVPETPPLERQMPLKPSAVRLDWAKIRSKASK